MMKFSFCVVALGAVAVSIAGCPTSFTGCDEGPCGTSDGGLTDGSATDSSTDAKPDADPPPPGCDTPNEPLKNPEKCLVDSFGVFVSPTGDDANPGTKAKPFKSLAKALGAGKPRIVACEGEYVGSLDVTTGVSLYGGVSCDFAKAGGRAKITASKAEYGIKIAKVSAAVLFSDVEVLGIAGVAPSESSIGVFVSESTNVQFVRAKIEAADGADAPPKKDGAFTLAASAPKGGNADDKATGSPADDTGGVAGTTGTCPGGGSSSGGKGGDNGLQGDDGSPRPPGGSKGAIAACGSGGTGLDGTNGSPGTDRPGAAKGAVLDATSFLGSRGLDGTPGTPGGGGGGGFGSAGAGGGGGAGGCGGQGGFGGGAGGSSVALVSFASVVTLQSAELVAKAAKPGGAGGGGQVGQAAGIRGTGSGAACNGGNGAKGGDGGGGGGGAGGIAAGIAWAGGSEPKRDAQTKIARPAGSGPAGGEGGAVTNKGVDGVHADVFEVK
jgi:hypothetical protein